MRSLLLSIVSGAALAATAVPDVHDIVQRSVAAMQANWNQAPNYSFQERDVESKHESAPTIKTYEVMMIDGSQYNRLIAINDRPLSPAEQADEERKLRAEIYRREHESKRERARRVAKYVRERNQDHAMMMAMAEAFDFRPAGSENVNGRECWVLDATPKRGYQPRDRDTKVLTGMRGRLWVDKKEYQWVKVKGEVFKSVGFFGFMAKVGPGTRFELEQEPVAENLWLPKHFSMRVSASALGFLNEDSTDDETYRDYRLRPALQASK